VARADPADLQPPDFLQRVQNDEVFADPVKRDLAARKLLDAAVAVDMVSGAARAR
jgi:hypothetical protein